MTDGTDTIIGTTMRADTTGGGTLTHSLIKGRFTIAGSKTFEIQHQCSSTDASGFGTGAGFSVVEVYTEVCIWKVA